MGTFLTYILPAIVPALSDGVRGIFAKFTGGAGGTPQNVDERIKLMGAETTKLQALASLDTPVGQPSQWVVDLRASFRYVAVSVIVLGALGSLFVPHAPVALVGTALDLAGASMSFIIGERMYFKIRGS